MTTQQRANLDSARRLAAQRIGWTGNTVDIPYNLREAYATELAAIILQYPERFDSQTLANARAEQADEPNADLEIYTAGDAAGDFLAGAGEGVGSVVESVAGVGEGVKSTLKLARWLIPVAAVVAIGIGLWALFLRAKPSKSAA